MLISHLLCSLVLGAVFAFRILLILVVLFSRALESKLSTSQSEVNRALWDKNNLKAELEEELSAYKIQISSLQKK